MFEETLLVPETALVLSFHAFDLFNDNMMSLFRLNKFSSLLLELLSESSQLLVFILALIFEVLALTLQVNVIIFDNLKLLLKELFIDSQFFFELLSSSLSLSGSTTFGCLLG